MREVRVGCQQQSSLSLGFLAHLLESFAPMRLAAPRRDLQRMEERWRECSRRLNCGSLKYPDQPFCGVGHDVAMNDFAPLPVRANVVPDLGDDNRAVYSANRRPNIRRHRSEGIYVEFEQLANGNRAPVALRFRTPDGRSC